MTTSAVELSEPLGRPEPGGSPSLGAQPFAQLSPEQQHSALQILLTAAQAHQTTAQAHQTAAQAQQPDTQTLLLQAYLRELANDQAKKAANTSTYPNFRPPGKLDLFARIRKYFKSIDEATQLIGHPLLGKIFSITESKIAGLVTFAASYCLANVSLTYSILLGFGTGFYYKHLQNKQVKSADTEHANIIKLMLLAENNILDKIFKCEDEDSEEYKLQQNFNSACNYYHITKDSLFFILNAPKNMRLSLVKAIVTPSKQGYFQ